MEAHFHQFHGFTQAGYFGETVKLEKTCWVHIKHVGISLFRTGDTSEPSFYETPVDSLDK